MERAQLEKDFNGSSDSELEEYLIKEIPISRKDVERVSEVRSWPRSKKLKKAMYIAESNLNGRGIYLK